MGLASQYAVMCVWSAVCVCVRAQDSPSLNSYSNSNLCIMIGDGPYFKCDDDTNPKSSSAVSKSDPTTVFTTVINPKSTTVDSSTTPKPATITPTAHPSPNSPDETKSPTQSPIIVDENVQKNQEDGQKKTGSPNCGSVWMGIHTEVFLLVVCGVLMLIMGTLSFCLYKQCKKQPVENLHLTRLISIPNPAFHSP